MRNGEITDSYKNSEWQYATPCFAFAVAATDADSDGPAVIYREMFSGLAAGNRVMGKADRSASGGPTGAAMTAAIAGFTGDGPATAGQASPSNLASLPLINSGFTAA